MTFNIGVDEIAICSPNRVQKRKIENGDWQMVFAGETWNVSSQLGDFLMSNLVRNSYTNAVANYCFQAFQGTTTFEFCAVLLNQGFKCP